MSLKVENICVCGFESALRGMRNPMNSWKLSDSVFSNGAACIGKKDMELMRKLYRAGTEHRKYLRMIHVQMDITTNSVVWAEFDTYKVATVRNSCSKMHKIHSKPFSTDDFSHEGIDEAGFTAQRAFMCVIDACDTLRRSFNDSKDKKYWRAMIELLPHGYNLKATVDLNYETVISMIKQRSGHKMREWRELTEILKGLPYISEIMADEV